MAKKARTPPPPRRVQAPRQRHDARKAMDPARMKTILYGLAGAGLVGVAVVLFVVFAGGKNGKAGNPAAVAATIRVAGCTLNTTKASPSNVHTSSLDQPITFSTYPPVSGRHFVTQAVWGNYSQEVDPRQAVHNHEHGGIVIWVGPDVSAAERQQITDFYDESPNGMLVTPIADKATGIKYPKHAAPGSKIYLSTWTVELKDGNAVAGKDVIATCPKFSEKAFAAFRDEFRGTGPERFPLNSLTPGT